jgi:hypothetical protein
MKRITPNRLLLTAAIALSCLVHAFAVEAKTHITFLTDSTPAAPQYLRLQLALDAINTDDTYIGFEANAKTQYVFNEDAPYFPGNGKVNLCSISSDNVQLAINKLPLPGKQSLAIRLNVKASADGAYKLNMTQMVNIPQLYEVWLMDNYTNDSLDMRKYKTYAFNLLKADTNSYGSKRFSLVIRQDPELSVHLLNFTATKASNGAQIAWTTENEQNYTNFAIEKSSDGGITFDVLDGFLSSGLGAYSFLDKTPVQTPVTVGATAQYRLKIEDLNGTISYSDVVTLTYGNLSDGGTKNPISIYPNPARNTLNLAITQADDSNSLSTESVPVKGASITHTANTVYSIKIFSTNGAVVKIATTTQSDWNCDVSNLSPGTYMIQILNDTDKSLVGRSKFIKL